jgi:hypothetical protein
MKSQNTHLKYGLGLFAALTGYFLLMKLFGLEHVLELRVLNLFIVGGTLFLAVRELQRNNQWSASYFSSFATSMKTAGIGISLFSLFMVIYLSAIDPSFMTEIAKTEIFGNYVNPSIIGFVLLFEGLGSAFLVTYTVMQYVKGKIQRNQLKQQEV